MHREVFTVTCVWSFRLKYLPRLSNTYTSNGTVDTSSSWMVQWEYTGPVRTALILTVLLRCCVKQVHVERIIQSCLSHVLVVSSTQH